MASERLVSQIVEALERVGADHGIDVVDVEVVGATKAPTVRVRIDHADEDQPTISLDEQPTTKILPGFSFAASSSSVTACRACAVSSSYMCYSPFQNALWISGTLESAV